MHKISRCLIIGFEKMIFNEVKALDLASIQHKLQSAIFHIHTPKTAGSYVNLLFAGAGKNHSARYLHTPTGVPYSWGKGHRSVCKGLDDFDEQMYNNCIDSTTASFSIVRNPYDVLTSKHFDNRVHNGHGDINTALGVERGQFDEFVKRFLTRHPWRAKAAKFAVEDWRDAPFLPLIMHPIESNFYFYRPFDDQGNCLVDFFIRFEYLDKALENLYSNCGKKYHPKSRWNVSPKEHYKTYWSDSLIEWAKPYLERQTQFFNYNFEGPLDNYPILDASVFHYNPLTDELGKEVA